MSGNVRGQHYTRNTQSVARHCPKCNKVTQHRVDDGRLGPCLECIAKLEATSSESQQLAAGSQQLAFPQLADFESESLRQINDLLYGKAAPFPLTQDQRRLLIALRFRCGKERAVQLAELCELVKLDQRKVKDLMRSLVVDFKVRIGASRTQPYGYYLITTAEEAKEAAHVYWSEVRELIKRARVLEDRHFVLERLGQLRTEIEEEKAS